MSAGRVAALAALVALGLFAPALGLLAPAAAAGDGDGPIRLVSQNGVEQADSATQPAISADGRYVAFQGSLGGLTGIFRKDLLTGEVALVVGASAYVSSAPGTDAGAPSISADGRYVSFTTGARLDPAEDPGTGTSVYVRDMSLPAPEGGVCAGAGPCAYELASARDGSAQGLTYNPGSTTTGARAGALASGRVALSADGREVAFVTASASDLTAAAAGETTTPAGQVAVRDLDTLHTTLVSAVRDPASGAMIEPAQPVPGGAVASKWLGAALSADGSTVAWLGEHIPAQVPLLSDEAQAIAADDNNGSTPYDEPLWRRIADGPSAPTRRILGGGDPLAPGCPPGGTLQDPACQGPFPAIARSTFVRASYTGWYGLPGDGVPQLSADGRTVALIGDPDGVSNVFLVDMHDGLARRQALRALTREAPLQSPEQANSPEHISADGDVWDAGISPDGRHVAFATARSQFPLAPPSLVGAPLAQLGLVELYSVDLDAGTLRRVTVPPDGGPSLGEGLIAANGAGASSPSFSADGRMLAFGSPASNLVPGDANGASDAFVVEDLAQADAPAAVAITPAPPALAPTPLWRMAVSAVSGRDGRVRLYVVVPGAGTLRARASAVVALAAAARRGRRGAHAPRTRLAVHSRRGRASRNSRRGGASRTLLAVDGRRGGHAPSPRTRLATRAVASAGLSTRGDGLVTLTLTLARPYLALARSPRGLDATVAVAFAGGGGKPLYDQLDVRFQIPRARQRAPRGGLRRSRAGSRGLRAGGRHA